MIGSLYYANKSIVDTSFDGIVYAANHISLNENGDTGQSVELQTDNELGNMFMIQYDPAIKGHKKFTSDGYMGEELIRNGTFDSDSEWALQSAVEISDGLLRFTDKAYNNTIATQQIFHEWKTEETYYFSFDRTNDAVNFGIPYVINNITSASGFFNPESDRTNEYASFKMTGGTGSGTIDNISVKQVFNKLEATSTHTQTTSFSNAIILDVEPTENDLALLNSDPTLIQQLIDGNTTGLSFLAVNVKYYYAGADRGNKEFLADELDPEVVPSSDMVMTLRTTASDELVSLPMSGTIDCTIDWGDGTSEDWTSTASHIYSVADDYTVKITGTLTDINFLDDVDGHRILTAKLGKTGLTSPSFRYCRNMTSIDMNIGCEDITNLQYFIYNCDSLTEIKVDNFIFPSLTSFTSAFFMPSNANVTIFDVSKWDMSKITAVSNPFKNLDAPIMNITGFDLRNAINLSGFFASTKAETLDFSNTNIDKCTSIGDIFNGSWATYIDISCFSTNTINTSLLSSFRLTQPCVIIGLDTLDTRSVTTMKWMFYNSSGISDEVRGNALKGYNIASLVDATQMIISRAISTAHYDEMLINWQGQPHQLDVPLGMGNSTYTLGGATETARNALVADGWIITDGGGV